MAATAVSAFLAPAAVPTSAVQKSAFCGTSVSGLPALGPVRTVRTLKIVANAPKKINVKEPLGPSGENKYRGGLDAQGRKTNGKGVYQFVKKYGANVDGYSPIWAPEEWSAGGSTYAGGTPGLLLWAVTLAGLFAGLAGFRALFLPSSLPMLLNYYCCCCCCAAVDLSLTHQSSTLNCKEGRLHKQCVGHCDALLVCCRVASALWA